MTIRLEIDGIEVELRRNSRRRTRIGMAFDPSGFVIMDAPPGVGESEVREVVAEHHRWLRVRLDKARDAVHEVRALNYVAGELVHYLGQAYRLEVRAGDEAGVTLCPPAHGQLPLFANAAFGTIRVTTPETSPTGVKSAVCDWYSQQADQVFGERLAGWSELPWLRGAAPRWRHAFMRSQWGSCSARGKISLNTHLIKAPVPLVDYVILHELCHLEHHDHSRRFYALMERHMPDWQRRRAALDRFLPVLLHD